MTTIAIRKPPDVSRLLASLFLAFTFFMLVLASLALKNAVMPAATGTILVPCRQCGQGCPCPRLGGVTMCGCPR